MKSNIRLLEERVRQVAKRVRELTDERDRLRGELETLRNKLVALEDDRPASGQAVGSEGLGPATVEEIAGTLEEAIRELRGS